MALAEAGYPGADVRLEPAPRMLSWHHDGEPYDSEAEAAFYRALHVVGIDHAPTICPDCHKATR